MSVCKQGSCSLSHWERVVSQGKGLEVCGTRLNSSGCDTVDTHHTCLDQRLNAVAEADLGEDGGSISAGPWSRLPDMNLGTMQWLRAEPVRSARFIPALPCIDLHEG
jgi:hypothetical protein